MTPDKKDNPVSAQRDRDSSIVRRYMDEPGLDRKVVSLLARIANEIDAEKWPASVAENAAEYDEESKD